MTGTKVLVVDDEPTVREVVVGYLRRDGHDVAEAGDPTRAAIAAVGAAEVYGLSILRNDLQDSSDNRTRFVLLSASEG